jgi:LmbE family N-acetylglucosaminyl deacetylase
MSNKKYIYLIVFIMFCYFVQAENILVFSAHHDDESIGLGGKIIQTMKNNGNVTLVLITDGSPDELNFNNDYALKRKNETIKAMEIAGVPKKNIIFLDYDDLGFIFDLKVEGTKKLIKEISKIIEKTSPDEIYVHAYEHGHIDHDSTQYIVVKAAENINFSKNNIYEYIEYNCQNFGKPINIEKSVVNNKKFPVIYLNISKQELETKKLMISQYKSQKIQCLTQNNKNCVSDMFFFGHDMIRKLPNYYYTKSPCKNDSCRWNKIIYGQDYSEFYEIVEKIESEKNIQLFNFFRFDFLISKIKELFNF